MRQKLGCNKKVDIERIAKKYVPLLKDIGILIIEYFYEEWYTLKPRYKHDKNNVTVNNLIFKLDDYLDKIIKCTYYDIIELEFGTFDTFLHRYPLNFQFTETIKNTEAIWKAIEKQEWDEHKKKELEQKEQIKRQRVCYSITFMQNGGYYANGDVNAITSNPNHPPIQIFYE